MFGHAAGDVGVVMLDADAAEIVEFERELGAEIAGVQIVRDGSGRGVKETRHALEGFLEEAEGFEVLEVAEMLAGDGESCAGEAEGVFLLRTTGQNFGFAAAEKDRLGGVAAGAAEEHALAGDDADHGVVDAGVDAAIVVGESVGDSGEMLFGFCVVDDDGLFADVAAGHDERGVGVKALAQDTEEEIVHGRAGKHDAGSGVAGRDGVGEIGTRAAAEQDDGALAAEEGVALFRGNEAEGGGNVGIGDHDGEGFFAAALAAAEFFNGGGLARVAGELIAAETFPGDDTAGAEEIGDAGEDSAGGLRRG